MKKILFICQANVGRSQMAEAFYNNKTGGNFSTSAGVIDVRKKYKYHPTEMIQTLMNEVGIDVSKARIKVVTNTILKNVSKIIILCDRKLCPDFIVNDPRSVFREVNDPHDLNIDSAREIRNQIENIVIKLI